MLNFKRPLAILLVILFCSNFASAGIVDIFSAFASEQKLAKREASRIYKLFRDYSSGNTDTQTARNIDNLVNEIGSGGLMVISDNFTGINSDFKSGGRVKRLSVMLDTLNELIHKNAYIGSVIEVSYKVRKISQGRFGVLVSGDCRVMTLKMRCSNSKCRVKSIIYYSN